MQTKRAYWPCLLAERSGSLDRVPENRLMNRRACVCIGLFLSCMLATCVARGQLPAGASGDPIPLAAKNATSAASANFYIPQIRQFIQNELTQLKTSDFAAQTAAKAKLVDECSRGSQPAFYAVYAREWSAAASPLMAPSAGNAMRLRLNIAIITGRLSEICQSLEIEPVVRMMLSDHDSSVALWGVKAARPLILVIIQSPQLPAVVSSKLIPTLVASVKSHDSSDLSGYIVTDAYHVLAIRDIPGLSAPQVKALVPPLVSPVLDILEARILQYAGTTPVPAPGAEHDVATFLSGSYPTAKPAEQARIVQDLVTLETYAGQRANLYTTPSDLAQLRDMLKFATSALKVIASNPGVDNALNWLSGIPPASPASEITSHTKQVWGTMQNVFKTLPRPPEIPVVEPPPPQGGKAQSTTAPV